MKLFFLKLTSIILLLIIIVAGCEKDEPLETDPAKIILGKWEMIKIGNYPKMESIINPSGFKEYLPDSILKIYEYKSGNYTIRKYWIDSILHEGVLSQGEIDFTMTYTFYFPDYNTLEIESYNMPSIFNNEVYKRIK
ncbi:MAG: hypothetical protein JW833_17780 [Prolixibacteraceae bacterium]|nr:hypothetical protein [Prolixibacteraceae bacterium]